MKRILLIAICLGTHPLSCVLLQASEQPLPVVVGTLGDPARLVFEGITTFTAEQIRLALMRTPEFLLASHPAAWLSDYLPTVENLIQTGYQHDGFSEPKVSVKMHENRKTISVKVSEGPRYLCGEIEITGADTLSVESLITCLTERRIKEADPSDTEMSVKSNSESPIWPTNEYTSFATLWQKKLNYDIKTVLAELGYYFCTFTAEVVPEPGTSHARLVVQIKEEGSRTIGEIIISGNKKNTRAEILHYLGLEEGMPLNRALIRKTEALLWRSARFLKHRVTPQVDTERKVIKLRIDLREYEPVPRLSESFSPEETMLLTCGDWLSGFLDREEDLTCDLYIEDIDTQLQVVVSPTKGALLVMRKGDATQGMGMLNAAIIAPKKSAFFSPTRKTKFVLPELSAKLLAQLSILPNPDPIDDRLFMIIPGVGINNNQSGNPYSLKLKLAPVCFVSCAYKDNIDLTHLLDQGIMRFTGDSNVQVKIDTQSGRLIEMTAHESGHGKMALSLGRGLFEQRVANIEPETSGHRDGFSPQRPVGSTLRYLAEMPLLHRAIFQLYGPRLNVSQGKLARAVTVLGQVLENAASPFDQRIIEERDVVDDRFIIPPNLGKTATSLNNTLVSWAAALVFGASNELFPPGSWPWTLTRETVFVASGMGKYTQMELGRTYRSPQTGPIGYLAAAKLLTYINKPLSRAFAVKGLTKLSSDDFLKDWRLLVAEDHLLSQCLNHLVRGLGDLDDPDLNAVLALFSQEHAGLIRDSVNSTRENEAKPMRQVLAPVFAYHWQNTLRTEVAQALRTFAHPTVNASSAEKKTPVVPPTTTKKALPRKGPSLPGTKQIVDFGFKASWSPDGKRLVFGRPQGKGLRIVDLESGKKTNLTSSGLDPAWSPDGRFIAYVERKLDVRSEEVWLVESDGKSPRKVAEGGYPSWSTNGKLLYVHSRQTETILAIDMDNSDAERGVFCDFSWSWYPSISPDGERIAFGTADALAIADRATRETILRWITPGSPGLLPAWSPNGQQVAFGGYNNERLGLWVLDVETGKAVQVAEGPYTMPAWSRDGTKLAFDYRSGNRREIWMIETKTLATLMPSVPAKSKLSRLNLINRQMTDADLAQQLEGITTLRELILENTPVTDTGLVHLRGLTSLERLLLGKTHITDAGLVHLKDLCTLKHLCLHDTGISDAGLAQLQGLTSLETLCLANTNITDAGLAHLQGLRFLKNLHINGTNATETAANALRRSLPNMTTAKPKPRPAQVVRLDSPLIDETASAIAPPDTSPVSLVEPNEADLATTQLKVLFDSPNAVDISRLRALIDAGADVNVRNKHGLTPLFMAARNGHIDVVELLVDAKVDINAAGITPQPMAPQHNNSENSKLPLETKSGVNIATKTDITNQPWVGFQTVYRERISLQLGVKGSVNNTRRIDGVTPLFVASEKGHIEIVALLLDAKADVNAALKTYGTTPLYVAAQNGHTDVVERLLESKADVNTQHRTEGWTPLYLAAQNGHTECVELLLKNNANVNTKSTEGGTALLIASQQGHPDIVKCLLTNGADVNTKLNIEGSTALMLASMNGHTESVKRLLENKADVNTRNASDATALMMTAQNGHTDIVNRLLESKADVNMIDLHGTTALLAAAQEGHTDVVKALLKAEAEVNTQRTDNATALIIASQGGHAEIVKALVEAKAEVDIQHKINGVTALYVATHGDHPDIVKVLLEANADANIPCKIGNITALWCAAHKGNADSVAFLLAAKADVNEAHIDGTTPLLIALQNGHTEIAKLLLKKKADVNSQDNTGVTALMKSAEQGHTAIVGALLQANADVNRQCKTDGSTALMVAAQNGHAEVVKLLLNNNAEVNITSKVDSATALHGAVQAGHIEVVRLLLKADAHVNAKINDGSTALMVAAQNGHTDIVKQLLKTKAKVNIQTRTEGLTALMAATQNGHVPIVALLVECKAEVNTQAANGATALILASEYDHPEIVRLLISNGADVTVIARGYTALSLARKRGHAEIVELLVPVLQSQLATWVSEGMPISPHELLGYYEAIKAKRFIHKARLHIRLIDIRPSQLKPTETRASDGETRQAAALRIAEQLCERVRNGDDFGKLAETYSHGFRRGYGGQWPPFTPNSKAPPYDVVDKHAQTMQVGQVSGPISKNNHVFILKLEQRVPKKVQSFDDVKDTLREELQLLKRQKLERDIRSQ